MPNLKASKKSVRQSAKAHDRNLTLKTEVKKAMKQVLKLVKAGNNSEAEKILPKAFSLIDTAAKRHVYHDNNAARKKSLLSRALASK